MVISLVTTCLGFHEEEPQTAHPMTLKYPCFTRRLISKTGFGTWYVTLWVITECHCRTVSACCSGGVCQCSWDVLHCSPVPIRFLRLISGCYTVARTFKIVICGIDVIQVKGIRVCSIFMWPLGRWYNVDMVTFAHDIFCGIWHLEIDPTDNLPTKLRLSICGHCILVCIFLVTWNKDIFSCWLLEKRLRVSVNFMLLVIMTCY